jgi:putative transposase
VLNYVVTSNHIHLLVQDQGEGEIAKSLQLMAGRTAQEYNQRKGRRGAYWQDRYHATAVDAEDYLARCLVYIDLNMVRAGAVSHPAQWETGGYREIQSPPPRYRIIDQQALLRLFGLPDWQAFQVDHAEWVESALRADLDKRTAGWSSSLAVGSPDFVEEVKARLGVRAIHRQVEVDGSDAQLREAPAAYGRFFEGENSALSVNFSTVSEDL